MEYITNRQAFLEYIAENCHCVNAGQTPEERRNKYKICRLLGDTVKQSERRRDWTYNHIARVHGFKDYQTMEEYFNGKTAKIYG